MPGFARTPFDTWMDELAALVDGKWFYGRVAGTDRQNTDGSFRQWNIAELRPRDELQLVPEPENEFDPNAIRVLTPAGLQIGYLEARLAGETCRRSRKGMITRAFVSNLTGTRTHGVVIGILIHATP